MRAIEGHWEFLNSSYTGIQLTTLITYAKASHQYFVEGIQLPQVKPAT